MSWLDDLISGYRTIKSAEGIASTSRLILKIIGATVTDDPDTGETIITIAQGTPLASVVGSGWIDVDDEDPQNLVVSISPAPSEVALSSRIPVRDSGGNLFATGYYSSAGFIGTASGSLSLTQAQAISGAGVEGLVQAQAAATASNANGGLLTLSGGAKDGSGIPGATRVKVGSRVMLLATTTAGDAILELGDDSNDTTPSVHLRGPVDSAVGDAGGADPLPAAPAVWYTLKVEGTTYVIPLFLPPS